MDHHAGLPFLRETVLFLTLAGILIPLLQRLRVNQVLGFLVIGVALGPHGLARWADLVPVLHLLTFPREQGVAALAELGVIFLMFLIGLELSPQRLWAMRRWVFIAGSAQVLISALVIGWLAHRFGNSVKVAIVLGLVLSLSSTAVVMQLLSQQRALASPTGQAAFAILMLQDIAVVPLLILIDLMARPVAGGGVMSDGVLAMVGLTLAKSALAVGLIYVGGRRVVAPVFRWFASQRQPDVFVALTLLATLGIAWLTAAAGLSMALGALLAGLLLAETEFRHEIEVTIEPFKGLLMGLFFMSVGMGIDIAAIGDNPVWWAMSVLGLIVIKAGVIAAILRLGGLSIGRAVHGGLLLGQGGEFAFIVVGYAVSLKMLQPPVAQFMMLVVSMSLMLTPAVARLGQSLGRWLDARWQHLPDVQHDEPELADDLSRHLVIAGFGRVGQLLAEVFDAEGIRYVAVEQDPHRVVQQRAKGHPVHYGHAGRPEMLRRLKLDRAAALLVTMDQPAAAMHAVRAARTEYPDLPIFARSRDEPHARELLDAGATAVVPETLESGLQLGSYAMHALQLPEGAIAAALGAERDRRIAGAAPVLQTIVRG